jgi:hypothetical protein
MGTSDLTGKRFGRLVVVSKTEPNRHKQSRWVCKCDCGKETIRVHASLMNGDVRSCGCLQKESRFLPGDEGSFNQVFYIYKHNADKREIEFSLTKEEFRSISSKMCKYCGSEPKPRYARNIKSVDAIPYVYNGIDRVENTLGYVASNCVPCCSLCNYMKRELSTEEFLSHIKKVLSYSKVN